jgi:hypothetical protein
MAPFPLANAALASLLTWLTCMGARYEGIVLVNQKWVVGAPTPDDTTDRKKLDKMTVTQIIAKGSKAAGVQMALGPEILHFRAGD